MAKPIKTKGVFAICPNCGLRRVLEGVPDNAAWPHCDECDELMNVMVPRQAMGPRRLHEAA